MYIKPLFSDGTASNKKKNKKKLTCTTEYMYEVELFHQSSSRILQMSFRTDSVNQDQTAQTI